MNKPGFLTSEFWLQLLTLGFGMWVGYTVITHPFVELERALAVMGIVGSITGYYTYQRTSLKKQEKPE